jgi:hypothetical protein
LRKSAVLWSYSKKTDAASDQVEKSLIQAIAHLRRSSVLPIATPQQQRKKMTPQKTNTAPPQRTLAFDKNPKKKKGISTPEKQANDRVNSRLAGLSEILLYCIVCDQMLDLHNNTALKRSRCLVP